MNDIETQQRFVALRADGWSFASPPSASSLDCRIDSRQLSTPIWS
ncbi:MAG TPA: hypothetical protein VL793_14115 [Patescibacteria group bacterium]|jgi:hypothetical protein|nr:hypothetical protein [Patescibacteria group bacterium]